MQNFLNINVSSLLIKMSGGTIAIAIIVIIIVALIIYYLIYVAKVIKLPKITLPTSSVSSSSPSPSPSPGTSPSPSPPINPIATIIVQW